MWELKNFLVFHILLFQTILDKLDESYEEAKEVITNTLRDRSAKEQLAYQPHDPDSVIVS